MTSHMELLSMSRTRALFTSSSATRWSRAAVAATASVLLALPLTVGASLLTTTSASAQSDRT